ncbi:MAG: hypothetical protein HZA22_12485 [Nitrospirae bacterium]|nr:hypothetical protein [Nitrospirota bacterium]MBI5695625.1 hypothetical protein [Nitrospirota bacterium]
MVLTLYVNDPMGKRCRINLDAAKEVQREYPVHVEVISKGSEQYAGLTEPPPCPSVALDGRIIKEYGVVTSEDLKKELLRFLL